MTKRIDLKAKRVAPTTWSIFEGTSFYPSYDLCFHGRWVLKALNLRYGVPYENQDLASVVNGMVNDSMTIRDALAVVRGAVDAQYDMFAREAEADRQTDLAVERFYENRMTDADKAQEDWEYGMFGA